MGSRIAPGQDSASEIDLPDSATIFTPGLARNVYQAVQSTRFNSGCAEQELLSDAVLADVHTVGVGWVVRGARVVVGAHDSPPHISRRVAGLTRPT